MSGDMAVDERNLESLLSAAREREESYDWYGAAESYAQVAAITPAGDALLLGNSEESAAYALHRHAFQAETREQFQERIAKATDQYAKAKTAYNKLEGESSTPWSRRCDAMIAYLGAWSTEDPAVKKRQVLEAWTWAKESMDAFERGRNYRQLRSTNNLLTLAVSMGCAYSKDPVYRESLLREGLAYSEKAAGIVPEDDDRREAATALVNASYYTMLLCTDFVDLAHKVEWDRRSGELLRKGLSVSREGCVEALSFTYKYGSLPSTLTKEETVSLRD
jgi:hypothetical protein